MQLVDLDGGRYVDPDQNLNFQIKASGIFGGSQEAYGAASMHCLLLKNKAGMVLVWKSHLKAKKELTGLGLVQSLLGRVNNYPNM